MATQPGTGLTLFQGGGAVPAHIANFFSAEGQNIQPRTTVPSLMLTGKVWTISIDGQKSPLQRRNTDGDLEPMPIMKVVVLEYNKQRGRSYYEGAYDPNNTSQPVCWSDDGVAPDASLPGPFPAGTEVEPGKSRKINAVCATCPMAVKGSKVIPGTNKGTVACAEHRMLAVLPDPAMQLPAPLQKPLRLKIAITSDWDAQSPDQEQQGWLSWSKYVDWLLARGCAHTAAIVTKMKFDPEAAYPKIFFSAERPLDANELTLVQGLIHSPDVKKLLGGTWTPAGADGVPRDQQDVAEAKPAVETLAVPQEKAADPATPPSQPVLTIPGGYKMAPDASHTYEQFRAAGWTDQQLVAGGKLIAAAPPPQPAEVVVAPPQTASAAAPAAQAVIVGEPAAAAAAPTATAAVASQPATEAIVVEEPRTTAPEQPAAPTPVQEPAQASAPAPAPIAQAPEPPAAQAAAASATPEVSTIVPDSVASLLAEWGDPAPAAA